MTRPCWMIVLPGYRPFPMVGGQMTYEEALEAARVIWPMAEVTE